MRFLFCLLALQGSLHLRAVSAALRAVQAGGAGARRAKSAAASFACARLDEVDAEAAVEAAEAAWAEALAARQRADELAGDAEALADSAGSEALAARSRLDVLPGEAAGKFSLSMLGDAQAAMSSSLEASGVLADAAAAFEEADRLEALAEEALRAVDAIIWDSNMGHDVDETN